MSKALSTFPEPEREAVARRRAASAGKSNAGNAAADYLERKAEQVRKSNAKSVR